MLTRSLHYRDKLVIKKSFVFQPVVKLRLVNRLIINNGIRKVNAAGLRFIRKRGIGAAYNFQIFYVLLKN